MPLIRRERQDRPGGVPAVADADLATGQAGHLDAIAVCVTQRALQPVKTRTRSFVRTPERDAFHVGPSLVGVFLAVRLEREREVGNLTRIGPEGPPSCRQCGDQYQPVSGLRNGWFVRRHRQRT